MTSIRKRFRGIGVRSEVLGESPIDFYEVFKRLPMPAYVESCDRRIVAVNDLWLGLVGGTLEANCGRSVDDFLVEDAVGCGRLVLEGGSEIPVTCRRVALRGGESTLVMFTLTQEETGGSAIHDRQEALRAGHLASLGEIAAGVAHEINNPINGIINYAQLLYDDLNVRGEKQAQVADRIMREGRRISKIVRTLLGFSRVSGDVAVATNLTREIEAVLSLTRAQIRKENIRLDVRIIDGTCKVVVSSNRMQQVILNLIHNARHALNQKYPGRDENKVLTISLGSFQDDCRWLRLTVRDEGSGIPAAIQSKILEPFFTTKPVGSGTGLGLSISRDIVRSHGGRLQVESVEGIYTAVHVDSPVEEDV